jgi:hypothetical protein
VILLNRISKDRLAHIRLVEGFNWMRTGHITACERAAEWCVSLVEQITSKDGVLIAARGLFPSRHAAIDVSAPLLQILIPKLCKQKGCLPLFYFLFLPNLDLISLNFSAKLALTPAAAKPPAARRSTAPSSGTMFDV